MNILLWIIQGFLTVAFVIGGAVKLYQSREKLLEKYAWVNDFELRTVRLIGTAEVLGGIGVTVPWLTNIMPILTPFAGAGLTILMIGAAGTHIRRKEYLQALGPSFLGLLAGFVAYGRFVL